MSDLVASVVIGFKDWGLDRLERCIASIHDSFGHVAAEVIVSDYGSAEGDSVAETARMAGARCVRTETDGTWSRSRALNAGFAVAAGTQFFATDADMIFTPGALAAVSERLTSVPHEALILQCRDLPPGVGTGPLEDMDWSSCERSATVRPRWGMGGLVASDRSVFFQLGGYDERMHTYGGEDIDYAKRLRRHGIPINWLDRPELRMYHVWHPSSRMAASLDAEAEAAIANNRRIHTEDLTVVRNVLASQWLDEARAPIVSVLAAADRPAGTLLPELGAILAQTVRQMELLLIGSGDAVGRIASELNDTRVRTVDIGDAVWWRAIGQAHGTYAVLHSPGSWYPSDRFERLLASTSHRYVVPCDQGLTAAVSGGDLLPLPASGGEGQRSPWASMLLRRDVASAIVDTLDDGVVDPNDLVFMIARNGLSIEMTSGRPRVDVIPTDADAEVEFDMATRSTERLRRRLTASNLDADWLMTTPTPQEMEAAAQRTQQLMRDRSDLVMWSSDQDLLAECGELSGEDAATRLSWVRDTSGNRLFGLLHLVGLSGATARRLRGLAAASISQGSTRLEPIPDDGRLETWTPLPWVIEEYSRVYAQDPESCSWIVIQSSDAAAGHTAMDAVKRMSRVTTALQRSIDGGDGITTHLVLGLMDQGVAGLRHVLEVQQVLPTNVHAQLWLGAGDENDNLSALTRKPA